MKKICQILMCLFMSGAYVEAGQIENTSLQCSNQIQGCCVEKGCDRGPQGKRGPRGQRGHGRRGKRGHKGRHGPHGPAGQPGIVIEYGSATLEGQATPLPLTLGLVPLDVVDPHSPNISFNTSTHLFTVNSAGTYVIEYYVQAGIQLSLSPPLVPIGIAVVINGIPEGIGLMPVGTLDGSSSQPPQWRLSERVMQRVQQLNVNDTVGLSINSVGLETWFYGKGITPNLVAFLSLRKIA